MNKKLVSAIIILWVIILSIIILNKSPEKISEQTAKCIGENSKLYVQLGCNACKTQEEMFGENIKYLNKTDCWFEKEKCSEIKYTPTWIIKGEEYIGVQSIKKLKELTGC